MTILALLTGLWLQPHGLAPVLVSGALILAVVWVIAGRWDILSVLLNLLALLLMGGLLPGWVGKLIHDQPAWLSRPVWFLSYFLAGLAAALSAVLIASALWVVQRLDVDLGPDQRRRRRDLVRHAVRDRRSCRRGSDGH